ncbi:hypothetical protein VPHD249_0032 [Vibrio phage D249]|nr:hypothetical protein SIPHO036v1_150016 [Vibrio phage 70E38.1]QZI87948.1 hypothetical protein SIPHO041v1_p0037 [Vibrio phage 234P1]QZI88117.1 hypothetical protein SIPHO035v1_p0026 [Vibrio phage 234P7B]QZI88414.1 hypothetical protein SIPHO082v1_p0137 [Vibrio phage 294E48.1]QZI88486.1 hypothetical protein SIPHO037v1_p0045 [Vibrio phage 70E35.2]QZI88669.1 hypothetical protein SIPHO039v1_p0040 [Vibrio phage 70E35.5a]QZI88855.1 hypothetical protein SIPHO040v1_p0042 [Vibrio phage 70E35.6]QZI8916
MQRFSYEKLFRLAFGNAELIVEAFRLLYQKREDYQCLTGDDFIVNPRIIYHNTYNLTHQQLAEYLGILSLRSYAQYKTHGYTDLEMARIPSWVPADVVKSHPLIEIKANKLHFKEEILCQD